MYIFPGIGLGALLSRASEVTDSMVEASSIGLATSLTTDEIASDLLYPRIERIREISAQVAMAVIRAAQKAVRALSETFSKSHHLRVSVDIRVLTVLQPSAPKPMPNSWTLSRTRCGSHRFPFLPFDSSRCAFSRRVIFVLVIVVQ